MTFSDSYELHGEMSSVTILPGNEQIQSDVTGKNKQDSLRSLNDDLYKTILSGDLVSSGKILASLEKLLASGNVISLVSSDSYYYKGIYYMITGMNRNAIESFRISSAMRIQLDEEDAVYAKTLYNMGMAYLNLGDFRRTEDLILKSLETERKLYGDSSPLLARSISTLVATYLNLNDFEKAISNGMLALNLIDRSNTDLMPDLAILYTNIGVCHASRADYTKAEVFLEQAEQIYDEYRLPEDGNYINLLNSLAITSYYLGHDEKAFGYLEKGIDRSESSNSSLSLNFMNSFANILGKSGNAKRGEVLLVRALRRATSFYGTGTHGYTEVLKNFAEFKLTHGNDPARALELYGECIEYLSENPDDLSLVQPVWMGYASALSLNGKHLQALEIVQRMLFEGSRRGEAGGILDNPSSEALAGIHSALDLLKIKYNILRALYEKEKDSQFIIAAAGTSELIIGLIDGVRINISEEESKLILGDRYRDYYLRAIRDFDLCHKITGDQLYLLKAFEYSEKSKVAGLLASTRELKASQFHIPVEIAEMERSLKKEILFYNAKLSEEGVAPEDTNIAAEWRANVLNATKKRDSLISVIEAEYPDYYRIKYNTGVIAPGSIPGIAGRRTNYLSYILSDTVMYIFVVNRKALNMVSMPVDSLFFGQIRDFRKILEFPGRGAKEEFERFTVTGLSLYKTLIEPIRKFLLSDVLLISPDNILSYIPFEALPAERPTDNEAFYRDLVFMMRNFRVSYTYSATFLAESSGNARSFSNRLIAFAPVYGEGIKLDTIFRTRQNSRHVLNDLPFARQEAEFVTRLAGGRLLVNNEAREGIFKSEASQYDIVHLAMHTVLNDKFPMYSMMMFYQEKSPEEDGRLNTYEVYGVPLNAKMVLLSSCNTGDGALRSGEGIVSLARGFSYSGSRSVVMSMWEIDDQSGTQIVCDFYRYLKRGYSKSEALRKARNGFLEQADMLRSHPYFWSSLVVYGNNTPLYYPLFPVILAIGLSVLVSLLFFIFRHRPK
jgi:CHAT domain-containing protein/Tfp pilus assembly protein PilF